MIIVVYKLFKPFADACLIAHPRVMKTVNSALLKIEDSNGILS